MNGMNLSTREGRYGLQNFTIGPHPFSVLGKGRRPHRTKEPDMKRNGAETRPFVPGLRPMTCIAAFVVAFAVSHSSLADAGHVRPPPVPPTLQVPTGNKAFLEGDAIGTQDYICLLSSSGFAWTFFGPQA